MPHTPGPWVVDQVVSDHEFDICLGYDIPRAGSPILVASVYDDEEDYQTIPLRDATSNAKLIAAAPDLLAFAQAHEAWEAEFIMANDCWPMTAEMLPRFNEQIMEKFLQLQKLRNQAVAKATK